MTRRITGEVYEADNVTYVGTLASDRGREWLDDLSAEGSYTIESLLDHTDDALLVAGRVIRFLIDGTPRWSALVEGRNVVVADPSSRQAGRIVAAVGRGLLVVFDDACVLPELGFGRVASDTRYFGWMSRYYDHSTWPNAVELKQQSDPDATKPWFGKPAGWPDPAAYWVGPTDGDVPGAVPGGGEPGYILLWGDYTVPVGAGGDHKAYLAGDDAWELYKDGDREATEQRVGLWGVTSEAPMLLDDGAHFFAVKATNFDRPDPSTNVFGFILTLARMADGGATVGAVIARSSAGTKMLAFPSTEPGMTVGAILLALIAENQDLGWQSDLTVDFDATVDSNGDPWPDELNVSWPVGTSLTEVLRYFTAHHAAEFAMDPVGKVLHAWISKGQDLTATVSATYAVDVSKLAMTVVPPGTNSAPARTAEGRWVLLEDPTAVAAYGRKLAGLSLGSAPSDASAEAQGAAFFADHAYPLDAITDMQVENTDFVDGTVSTGDLVLAPTATGTAPYRVHGLRFAEDDAGEPIVTPELVKV